jgi:site-specific DNA-methyltransferase (adenine-specific)
MEFDKIITGDCLDVLQAYPPDCIDSIVTSPPYADKRDYAGATADDYVSWLLPRSEQFLRVLKPTGSFILNLNEGAAGGERRTYVLQLILALKAQGWHWVETYHWHKLTCYPGKWANRFRDAHEPCFHFTKARHFYMDQDAVMTPAKQVRVRNEGVNITVGSGLRRNRAAWIGRTKAYPSNVLSFSTESNNHGHPAAFPVALPEWFIKLFTKPGDVVLDPFVGSGTTAVAAKRLGRHWLGIDLEPAYCEIAERRIVSTLAQKPIANVSAFTKQCANCGEPFQPKRSHAKTCSKSCRVLLSRRRSDAEIAANYRALGLPLSRRLAAAERARLADILQMSRLR